jgi:SAM-dependent methyltransferase
MSPTQRKEETYESLWGELMFGASDPDQAWRANEGRADWFETLGLGDRLNVLDLGCGNGFLDYELARRGHSVTGVDQVQSVLDTARILGPEPVQFIFSDLRELDFDTDSFDVVLMFGLLGLMSISDDTALLRKTLRWMRPNGTLLADCDLELAETQTLKEPHPDGVIYWNWTSDEQTRTNQLTPELHRNDGVIVGLRDPIDPQRVEHIGLHRHVYRRSELSGRLEEVGFTVEATDHFLEYVFPDTAPESFMLLASRAKPSGV